MGSKASMSRTRWAILALILGAAPLAGCVVYEPYPGYYYYPGGTNFDRAWNAALGGVQDAGVQVSSSDPATGLIRGSKDGIGCDRDGRAPGRWQRARPVRREGRDAAGPGAGRPVFACLRPAHGPLRSKRKLNAKAQSTQRSAKENIRNDTRRNGELGLLQTSDFLCDLRVFALALFFRVKAWQPTFPARC